MSVVVELSRDEMVYAAEGAVARQIDARLTGRRNYYDWGDPWERDVLGAMAELAAAKHFDRYWTPLHERPTGVPDLGRRGQVRSTKHTGGHLLVYPPDADDQAFLLVTCALPRFTLVGWLYGREAKRDEWWRAERNNRHGGTWFAPQAALRPVEARAAAA